MTHSGNHKPGRGPQWYKDENGQSHQSDPTKIKDRNKLAVEQFKKILKEKNKESGDEANGIQRG